MTQLKIITTEDGSHSLYREDLHESYHSFHGAWGESMHVFIENGLSACQLNEQKECIVFEVGLGTGLNALLAAIFAEKNGLSLEFHSVEPIPIPEELYRQLNYGNNPAEKELLQLLHQAEWGKLVEITDHYSLAKYKTRLEDLDHSAFSKKADVIFFDAFAPSKQSEMWALGNLKKCFALLRRGGLLTTYCAQGQFKRDLGAAGFQVETLKGALGKKEMVRGVKP